MDELRNLYEDMLDEDDIYRLTVVSSGAGSYAVAPQMIEHFIRSLAQAEGQVKVELQEDNSDLGYIRLHLLMKTMGPMGVLRSNAAEVSKVYHYGDDYTDPYWGLIVGGAQRLGTFEGRSAWRVAG